MNITATKIAGVYIVKREPFSDERGTFSRMFCRRELEAVGLCGEIAQMNLSTNRKKGTLRGLHSQSGNAAEDKLVTCVQGAIFDVCVDVRKDSPTYLQWVGETLSEENGIALYVPKGCAHGYLTLTDNAQVLYLVTQYYMPNTEVGYRYDDPAFGITWPIVPPYIMSEKDKSWGYIGSSQMDSTQKIG
ncbi:dTDP-4-dehydrorhamnose 3,5-epimerase [Heliophilum fasciatum]|uniref:dTDP-4-dehydrorhamnose 3,5-epimerase n=1 Tax=Heliophilum fasciatum TaxID=35700 RepID=A0A4R2RLU0_9FIRM|nr:dTDP-4-dehydrorhamnose 3,5-epimerase [Heliophilum fasciatum]MCW2278811.1 dTDP-4-dehydrorhamnose 3,5-epimerase [Heliophilum fasciatum]TCP64103.1 dTDP-4-dehydrorhamnose 3,5-epimerase [Heliophilum fasciatum]